MSFNSGMKGADVVALLKNGLPIVDDVSKLDPNAELGSMASVVSAGSIQETSIRNLYQPDASMLDPNAGILTAPELLSSVCSIKVFAPTDIDNIGFELVESGFYLVPRDFSIANAIMVMVQVVDGNVFGMCMRDGTGEYQEFILVESSSDTNSFVVHDDQVEAFNAILANGMDWCYFADPQGGFVITEEQFNTIDLFVNVSVGMPSIADIYVKGDKWTQLYKKDLEKLAKDLDETKITISEYNGCVNPNTYTTYTINTSTDVFIPLKGWGNFSTYTEYIIELKCLTTPRSLIFENPDASGITTIVINWANGAAPIPVEGMTYLISIANGLGVFSIFHNS